MDSDSWLILEIFEYALIISFAISVVLGVTLFILYRLNPDILKRYSEWWLRLSGLRPTIVMKPGKKPRVRFVYTQRGWKQFRILVIIGITYWGVLAALSFFYIESTPFGLFFLVWIALFVVAWFWVSTFRSSLQDETQEKRV
jgi:hypothetical protein